MGTRLILGFAFGFFILILSPAVLPQQLAAGPVPRLGDLVDLLTPFVLIPVYYALFRSADDWASEPPAGLMTALFMFGAILFIEGHGMHLAANSIGHFLPNSSDGYAIAYFYDEILSHYMWHAGVIAFSAVLLWRHYLPVKKGVNLWRVGGPQQTMIFAGSALYGLTVALAAIEGQSAIMDLSAAIAIAGWFLLAWRRQRQLPGAPVFTFLGISYVLTAVLLAGWGLYWRGFPQLSDIGLIQ